IVAIHVSWMGSNETCVSVLFHSGLLARVVCRYINADVAPNFTIDDWLNIESNLPIVGDRDPSLHLHVHPTPYLLLTPYFQTSAAVFLTMSLAMGDEQVVPNNSQLSEEGNGWVLSTQCPTKAQSAIDVRNINVNPELPVDA
ncbi:hypothetical protein S245_036426, partial [Arachis hypogaea]